MSDCQIAHSIRFAKLLTSLAGNIASKEPTSWVTIGDNRITTPQELFQNLIEHGHQIESLDERTYANFVSVMVDDRMDGEIPVWLDSGFPLSSGRSLVIPMGHSQQAWRIFGPSVNVRVVFFLGTSGLGFHPQIDERPAWTGLRYFRATRSTNSSGKEIILQQVETASTYFKRNRRERGRLPADGYGPAGVCNDVNALVQLRSFNEQSSLPYPLMRVFPTNVAGNLHDGLAAILDALPRDIERFPNTEEARTKLGCRILRMSPRDPAGSSPFLDSRLRAEMRELNERVGARCSF